MIKYILLLFITIPTISMASGHKEKSFNRHESKPFNPEIDIDITFPVEFGDSKFYAIGLTNIHPNIAKEKFLEMVKSGTLIGKFRITLMTESEEKSFLINLSDRHTSTFLHEDVEVLDDIVFFIQTNKLFKNSSGYCKVELVNSLSIDIKSFSIFIDDPPCPFYEVIDVVSGKNFKL